jgi:hypothetical protein
MDLLASLDVLPVRAALFAGLRRIFDVVADFVELDFEPPFEGSTLLDTVCLANGSS